MELLDGCSPDTGIAELKRRALEAAAAAAEPGQGAAAAAALQAGELELTFMGQACEDGKALRDYGVCHGWIAQAAGFVLRPAPRR